MPNKLPLDRHDTPLEFYLENLVEFSEPLPTIEQVKDAIVAFCPFDPRTGNLLAGNSTSSLRVLKRILYLPYYPEALGLINNPFFVAMCLIKLEEYLQRHKVSFVPFACTKNNDDFSSLI